jgi:hypothetical protein
VNLTEPSLTGFAMATVMLAKMCGWNEPERQQVQHIHLQVDGALIEQLRAGYAEMSATRMGISMTQRLSQPTSCGYGNPPSCPLTDP